MFVEEAVYGFARRLAAHVVTMLELRWKGDDTDHQQASATLRIPSMHQADCKGLKFPTIKQTPASPFVVRRGGAIGSRYR
jgi:hypothetical protein